MTAPAVGSLVYVLWAVGTPYGLAGEITRIPYDVNVQMLVSAGYGHLVHGFDQDDDDTPFGHEPQEKRLVLSKGADYTQKVYAGGGSLFPEGTTSRIDIVNPGTRAVTATWTGTVTPEYVQFAVAPAQADTIPARYRYRLYVTLPGVPNPRSVLWYYGSIERKE